VAQVAKIDRTVEGFVGITIEPPKFVELLFHIEGEAPGLLMHRFGSKAQREIEESQTGKAKAKKGARDPEAEYEDALYYLAEPSDGALYGMPVTAFGSSIISAATRFYKDFKSTSPTLRGAIRVIGVQPRNQEDGLQVPIHGEWVRDRRAVRLSGIGRTADLRYRPLFPKWSTDLRIRANLSIVSSEQITAFVSMAGSSVGIGDGRIEKFEEGFGSWRLISVGSRPS
jgi:hypothetical protein